MQQALLNSAGSIKYPQYLPVFGSLILANRVLYLLTRASKAPVHIISSCGCIYICVLLLCEVLRVSVYYLNLPIRLISMILL